MEDLDLRLYLGEKNGAELAKLLVSPLPHLLSFEKVAAF